HDPEDILKRYKAYIKKLTPKGIETSIKVWSMARACVVDTNNKYVKAATEALHGVFKKNTVFMGFGLPDDNLHAPNEKFHIPNFYRGIESICLFFEKLGE